MKHFVLIASLLIIYGCDNKSEVAECVRYNHERLVDYWTNSPIYIDPRGWPYSRSLEKTSEARRRNQAEVYVNQQKYVSKLRKVCKKDSDYIWTPQQ